MASLLLEDAYLTLECSCIVTKSSLPPAELASLHSRSAQPRHKLLAQREVNASLSVTTCLCHESVPRDAHTHLQFFQGRETLK